MIRFGFSYDGLKRLGIYIDYEDLVDLEHLGRFPKQIEHKVWDAEHVLK